MDPSFKLVPSRASKSASVKDTANSLGLHDTLRYGPRSIAAEIKSEGGLKERLENWEETQDNIKLTLQRNVYGMHAPMRLLMERKIVSASPHMPAFAPTSNVHLDILMGRDETIEPVDVFGGMEDTPPQDIHKDMEKKLKM
ncbi:proteasome maturation factor UMP1 [Mycena filopes]|nr:proteasome maturation factor UMP1 [Mycena filopes]